MLTEVGLRRRIGKQTILLVPAQLLYRDGCASCSAAISLCNRGIAKCRFHLSRIANGLDELQRDNRGAAIFILRRHPTLEILAPIDKRPPRYLPYQAIRTLALEVPIKNGPHTWNLLTNKIRIIAVHPEIVHHANPQQRERGNDLHQ